MASNTGPFRFFELQNRLIQFGVGCCRLSRRLPRTMDLSHIAKQLVHAATSPSANYGEARAAESTADFVHKLQLCLKELRESAVWLTYVRLLAPAGHDVAALSAECEELTSMIVASIRTTRQRRDGPDVDP